MGNAPPRDLTPPGLLTSQPAVAKSILDTYQGLPVERFCAWYHDHDDNHCAHFVSHALKLRLPHAKLCTNVGDNIVYADRKKGYCVDVAQIFNSCGNRKRWADTMSGEACFIVATLKSVIETEDPLTLNAGPSKHIGILLLDRVYNYSNSTDRVVTKTIAEFHSHYGKNTILLRADIPT